MIAAKAIIKRRIGIIFAVLATGFCILIGTLYLIQIKRGHTFTTIGQQQYLCSITQTPTRAPIYDRFGAALAITEECHAAFISPRALTEYERVAGFLNTHYPTAYQQLKNKPHAPFLFIKRHLSDEERAFIEKQHIDDIGFIVEPNRLYPLPEASPIIGITTIDNNGVEGLEHYFNERLAGTPSTFLLYREARNSTRYFKKIPCTYGEQGKSVTTTLDATLQFLITQELKKSVESLNAHNSAAIIMDPKTGDIRALAHYPYIDPSHREEYNSHQNRAAAITDVYELGSVMKVFPALAALETGVVTSDELINCENTKETRINGIPIHTWKNHGLIAYADVIRGSNNIGTSKVSLRLGKELYTHYRRCGFGSKTGITFPGEQDGTITHPTKWSKASPLSLSFGYEISASLIQLASAFSLFANEGRWVKPRLILDPETLVVIDHEPRFSPEAITHMRTIMNINHQQSTSRWAALPDYTIFGKTGTARLLTNGTYDPKRCMYTFAGIVEKDDYQRIIITWVKEAHGKNLYAATVAVPLFKRIAQIMVLHERATKKEPS